MRIIETLNEEEAEKTTMYTIKSFSSREFRNYLIEVQGEFEHLEALKEIVGGEKEVVLVVWLHQGVHDAGPLETHVLADVFSENLRNE